MPDIKHALVTLALNDAQFAKLSAALAPARVTRAADTRRETLAPLRASLDVAFLKGHVNAALLEAPRLRWIHCHHAGVERSAVAEVFRRDIALTSAAGRSAPALAEHALMFMSALNFGYPGLFRAQARGDWKLAAGLVTRNRPLCEATLGIVGAGHTGRALAERGRALGMRVLGYRRRRLDTPPGFDHMYSVAGGDSLDRMLGRVDFLVLAAPLTDASANLIGRRELAAMKSGAFLINIARGALIDHAALGEALACGHIAGAGLDVFPCEPLAPDSPWWTHPRVLVTPHARPTLSDRDERALRALLGNIQRYRAGTALKNQLTGNDRYTENRGRGTKSNPAPKNKTKLNAVAHLRQTGSRLKHRLVSAALSRRPVYPLKPQRRVRADSSWHDIDPHARLEVFRKNTRHDGTSLSLSLFVHNQEVARFDCLDGAAGHYHVADHAGFQRIWMYEQDVRQQIDRALFEIENNAGYLLSQNPKRSLRGTRLDARALAGACAQARQALHRLADELKPDQCGTERRSNLA